MKRIYLIFLPIFFLANFALADTSQTNYSVNLHTWSNFNSTDSDGAIRLGQITGNYPLGVSGNTTSSLEIYADTTGGGYLEVTIFDTGTTDTLDLNYGVSYCSYQTIGNTLGLFSTTAGTLGQLACGGGDSFGGAFNPAHYYVIRFVDHNVAGQSIYGKNSSSAYRLYTGATNPYSAPANDTGGVPYLKITGATFPNYDTSSVSSDELSFIYPLSTSTVSSAEDFNHFFKVKYKNNSTSTLNVQLSIDVKMLNAFGVNIDQGTIFSFSTSVLASASTTFSLAFYGIGGIYSNTQYSARAEIHTFDTWELRGVATTTFLTGSTSSYAGNVQPLLTNNPFNVTSTDATSSIFYVDCSGYTIGVFSSTTLDGVVCAAKKGALGILGFLFTPPGFVNSYFQDSFQSLKNTFPFSLISSITSAYNVVRDTTVESLTLQIPSLENANISNSSVLVATSTDFWVDHLTTPDCNSVCATARKNTMTDISRKILYLLGAIVAIIIIL